MFIASAKIRLRSFNSFSTTASQRLQGAQRRQIQLEFFGLNLEDFKCSMVGREMENVEDSEHDDGLQEKRPEVV